MHQSACLRIVLASVVSISLYAVSPAVAEERVPGDRWMQYANVAEAGFDAAQLETAHHAWSELPSSAFMVIRDGAVVAAWGDVDRRFMCHSVRKSFLSALFGIYWDRGELKLNKTLADLGIDDAPDPLLDVEKQARILDLLKARSGVFHPAAYAGRTDSQPRGSQGPGRYFAYNNWDFNTLATILEQETGDQVFEAFDEHFGKPLAMTDWRVSDGYYHYERDKSMYPAYPFRMSARDAARFGLLFARGGMWGEQRILSEHWVNRSLSLYSIDNDVMGYGFMWWVFRESRFAPYGMASALGVGNQMIAVFPKIDMVIINRANTYDGESTPLPPLLNLIESILAARTGPPAAQPNLIPLSALSPDPGVTHVAPPKLEEFVGTWTLPARSMQLNEGATITVQAGDGHLSMFSANRGTFNLYLQPNGTLHQEDSLLRFFPIRDASGTLNNLATAEWVAADALDAIAANNSDQALDQLDLLEDDDSAPALAARAVIYTIMGDRETAQMTVQESPRPAGVETEINSIGYRFMQSSEPDLARDAFELNTEMFPESSNAWDSLAEVQMHLGEDESAIQCYERSLELNGNNANAQRMLSRLRRRLSSGS